MKILLIVPRYNLTNEINYNYTFPLGLSYISAALKKEKYDADCLNLNHCNGTILKIITKILNKKKYDFVCTGHTGIGYVVIKNIIDSVRIHKSSPRIVLGGPIISSEPEIIFKSLKPDFGVIGEGEKTIIELLKFFEAGKDLTKVDGIIFQDKDSNLITTKKREVIMDLDSLPYPDFDGFGFGEQIKNMSTNDSYVHNMFDYPRVYPILCSRSCPFQCTFCYHSLGRKYRARSIDNVIDEIKTAIKKYKINGLSIYDDLFSVNKERLLEFCKKIKEITKDLPWTFKWTCQLTVHNIDKEFLKTLKDAGCIIISFGFESISPTVLKSMQKPITVEQINNAIKLTFETKMSLQGNFIFGDVAETKETANETLYYWKKNCMGQIGLDFIQPYPGSYIYYHCIKKGLIKDKMKFIETIGERRWYNMTDKMTNDDMEKLKKEILKAMVLYRKSVSYRSIKKIGKNKYAIKSKCPYCRKIIEYKNLHLNNPLYFSEFMICRNCNMRFGVSSSLNKFVRKFSPQIQSFMEYYVKMRKNFFKKRI